MGILLLGEVYPIICPLKPHDEALITEQELKKFIFSETVALITPITPNFLEHHIQQRI